MVDETGFLKKGTKSVGVQRQYSGTAGRIENCRIGVFLTYATAHGRVLLDRELYLPQGWADAAERRREAAVPEEVVFRTKPQLAREMLERAVAAGVPFRWVAGDEVYGNDRNLRRWLESAGISHVLAIKRNEKLWDLTDKGPRQVRADQLVSGVAEIRWSRCSAGNGAKGPRVYDWTRVVIRPLREPGKGYWLFARRSIAQPEELAYYVCFGPATQSWRTWCGSRGPGGPSRSALRRPRDRWDWISMKCGNGRAGTGTSPWRCWHRPTWRWSRQKANACFNGKKGGQPEWDEALIPLTVPEVRPPAVPVDLSAHAFEQIGAGLVPVETAPSSQGPPLPLPAPPGTP